MNTRDFSDQLSSLRREIKCFLHHLYLKYEKVKKVLSYNLHVCCRLALFFVQDISCIEMPDPSVGKGSCTTIIEKLKYQNRVASPSNEPPR